jgi:hypothetical protein
MPDDIRGRIRAFTRQHRLSNAAMARHARIPYRTLLGVLEVTKTPRPATVASLELAMANPPPQRLPKHAGAVAAQWGTKSSTEIGRPLGISGARVRAIAKRMRLTAGDTPAQP